MTTTYQERPRRGGGTECLLPGDESLVWRRLLPIAFTAENAQKVHDGSKTQTRRLLNPQPRMEDGKFAWSEEAGSGEFWIFCGKQMLSAKPRYRVGDVLWVQEPWRTGGDIYDKVKPTMLPDIVVRYQGASGVEGGGHGKLRPGRFLPLRFARPARYEVTAVRVERVNEISEADAKAEGCNGILVARKLLSPRQAFRDLWNSIHGTKPGTRFDDAPWVFSYTFRRI